jgi:uncharacterized protein
MRAGASAVLWALGWPIRAVLLLSIQTYRGSLGKLFGGRCRFYPSCSEYAAQAIARTGVARGVVLTAWRVARCSPLTVGGVDRPPAGRLWPRTRAPRRARDGAEALGGHRSEVAA